MYTQALSYSGRLGGILTGTDSGFHRDRLFDVVLNLMPSSLSHSARAFVAFIVSVLLSYGASYLWRSFFKCATASGEVNRIAADQAEANNAGSRICERQ
jgi:hypothetical protein